MSAKPIRECTECGRFKMAFRRLDDQSWCAACTKRLFCVPAACAQCGRAMKVRKGETGALCWPCRRDVPFIGRACCKCGRSPLLRNARHLLPDGRACCGRCRVHLVPPRECQLCGRLAQRVSRHTEHGVDKPACAKCSGSRSSLVNCAGCRRPRRPAGERDGKAYCVDCLPTGRPPVQTCTVCGNARPRFTRTECEDCAWHRYNERLLAELRPTLHVGWVRDLFERYHRESRVVLKRGNWQRSVRRDADFFSRLGRHFDSMESLSAVLIVRRLGWPAVRAHRRAMSFLAQQQLIVLDEDPDYLVEIALDKLRQLVVDDTPWIADLLDGFLRNLLNTRTRRRNRAGHRRVPITAKSLESAIRVGRMLLTFAAERHGAQSAQGVTQEVVDYFLAEHKQRRLRLAAFAHYLNQHGRLFHRLKLPRRQRTALPVRRFMPEERRVDLIERFVDEQDAGSTQWAMVAVLMLVYGQSAARAVRLPLSAIREAEGCFEIRLAKIWLDVDPIVEPLLRRWLALRSNVEAFDDAESNPFLFPGQRSGTHRQARSFQTYRQRFGVDGRSLRATGIRALVQGGATQARILIDGFGLSPPTAQMYLTALNVAGAGQAKHAFDTYGR